MKSGDPAETLSPLAHSSRMGIAFSFVGCVAKKERLMSDKHGKSASSRWQESSWPRQPGVRRGNI
jgi:hypothetical protein